MEVGRQVGPSETTSNFIGIMPLIKHLNCDKNQTAKTRQKVKHQYDLKYHKNHMQ